jgi:hypothetical protein
MTLRENTSLSPESNRASCNEDRARLSGLLELVSLHKFGGKIAMNAALSRRVSGYPHIGEPAGLVKEHKFVYVRHQLRLIDAKNTLVPSTAFGGGLTELLAGAT